MKSREMAKNSFSSIFPAFFAGKIRFFENRALCISVPNFMKKYKVQLEKFKKYHISGENRLFRRFLESSGYKNQFN